MLDISPPEIDFVALAQGLGVPAIAPGHAPRHSPTTWSEHSPSPGPHLIDAVVPSLF